MPKQNKLLLNESILKRNIQTPLLFLVNKTNNLWKMIKNRFENQENKIDKLEKRIQVLETLLYTKI
jgi:hypothetical protein